MSEITITEEDTGPDAPSPEATDNQSEDRPEWLPEKFATPEELAKSYAELEKKLSGPKDAGEETTGEPEAGAVSFDKFSEEFADKGSLSDDSIAELEKMGYPKEMVDTYLKGLQSSATADAEAVMGVAGGADGYSELTEWAKENVSAQELEVYNQMVGTSTDNAKMAVEWLMSKREAVEGSEPSLVQGKAAPAAKDEYRSTAEVVAAMKDPRYGKDPAYTKDVEGKLGRSNVF